MKFRYIGQESDADVFGLTFPQGVSVEVHDGHAIRKLSAHPLFEMDGEASVVIEQPRRRGRPPKVTHGEQNGS